MGGGARLRLGGQAAVAAATLTPLTPATDQEQNIILI